MNHRITLSLALLATLTLGGCAHFVHNLNPVNWFGDDNPPPPPAPLVALKPAIQVGMSWHTRLDGKSPNTFSPAGVLDAIFVADNKNQLLRLNPDNGNTVWRTALGMSDTAAVGASPDSEYTGSLKGELKAWNRDGKLRWSSQLSSTVVGVPKESDGVVVVRTENGDIYGLDDSNGKQKWHYQHTLPPLTLHASPSVTIYRSGVFAGYAGGKLVALTLDTGTLGWEADVSVPRGASEIERVNDVTSTPVVDDEEACAVSYQGKLSCFSVRSGALMWSKEMSSTAGLAMDSDNVYVSDVEGNIYAYEKEHGVNRWKQPALHLRQLTAPRLIGGYLAVGDYQGYVHFLSLSDGHFVARIATDGSPIVVQPMEYRNNLLVQTSKGGVFLIKMP